MRELKKDEIFTLFEEINRRLALEDKHGEILVTGGAALTLVFNARTSTYDIDAVFHPIDDMRKVISNMTDELGLPHNWINDSVKTFVTDKLKFEVFRSYSNLSVSIIDAESLLAMKLTSARFGSKDMDDSIFLMKLLDIQTEQALLDILDKYIDPFLRKTNVKHFVKETFEKYQGFQRKPSLMEKLKSAKRQ